MNLLKAIERAMIPLTVTMKITKKDTLLVNTASCIWVLAKNAPAPFQAEVMVVMPRLAFFLAASWRR
jgi:hypothetical protein